MPGIYCLEYQAKVSLMKKSPFPASYHYVAKDNNTNGYESIPGVQYHLEY